MLTEVRSVPTFKRLDWMTKQFSQFFATAMLELTINVYVKTVSESQANVMQ
jgi:hypothetical protein